MEIGELVLEVTRKCNMLCEHCLRGNAQAMNMSHKVIDNLLNKVTCISTVAFTGGEPTLNVNAIKYFTQQIRDKHITVGYFYVVTNGKIQSMALIKALLDLYILCEEQDMCGLCVSRDQYHEGCKTPLYEAITFYHPNDRAEKIPSEAILSEGRAEYNGLGCRYVKREGWELNDGILGGTVYISSNGNVLDACNLSYEHIDEDPIGNILTEDFESIVNRFAERDQD